MLTKSNKETKCSCESKFNLIKDYNSDTDTDISTKTECQPYPIQKCKPKCVPMTLEIKPIITLVVDKPELDICNRALCIPNEREKTKSKPKCKKYKKSKQKYPKKNYRCECYEEYWSYYY